MAEITDVPLELKRRYKNYRNNDISDVSHEESFPYFLGRKVYYITTVNSIDKTRFEIIWTDYIAIRDLPYIKDDDFNAFGVWIPKNIILEVFSFHKDNNDAFSLLVKKYSFIHLIFLQWITIKLFYKHKEITNNHTLTYKDFMESNFTFTYDNKIIDIYQAIDGINIEEINDKEYTAIDGLSAVGYGSLTVYDIIYDIIPNSIKRVFLHNIDMIKTYLPINQDDFMYKEVEIRSAEKIHKDIYGEDIPFNASNIPKEWYVLHALTTTSAIIYDSDLLVPKAIINTYGKGYNEIVEMMEVLLDLNALKCREDSYMRLLVGYYSANVYDTIFDYYKEVFVDSDKEIPLIIEKANCIYKTVNFVVNNNYYTKDAIFEVFREAKRQDPKVAIDHISVIRSHKNTKLAGRVDIARRTIYRFNQILAMMFINAYNKDK